MPKRVEYNAVSMDAALKEIKVHGKSRRSVAKKYGIPRSTLQFKLKNPGHKETCGPSPILSKEEENILVKWIEELGRKGFPRKKEDILCSVQMFLTENLRPNPFKDNRPGDGWLKAFMISHPQIVVRMSESVTAASACVSEADIRKWFEELTNYIKEKNLTDVINDPSRVFNGDETGFQICPTTGKVLAIKGTKNVYSVEQSSSKEFITVMFTFSASGNTCYPMIVYPYKRIPEKIAQSVPDEWGVGRSDNGWMTAEVFYEYVANVFHPYLLNKGITFPVILFVDGHKSHLTYQLSLLCTKLQIELIALYPNATRILQPADVAVFRPVKENWKKSVRDWYANHPGEVLNKLSFAPLLKDVIDSGTKPETLINGFRACGIFPLNADAVDYDKCLGKSKSTMILNHDDGRKKNDAHPVMSYDTFSQIVGNENLKKFNNIKEFLSGETEEFFTLFRMWEYFQTNNVDDNGIVGNADISQDRPTCYSTPNINAEITDYVNVSETNISRTERNENLQLDFTSQLEKGKEADKVQTCSSLNDHASTSRCIDSAANLSNLLMWPETPKRKGKRQIERQPYAITSQKFQDMCEKKRTAKEEKEKDKEAKKNKREETKLQKDNEAPKPGTKRKLFTSDKVEVKTCVTCSRNIKPGFEIYCDACKESYHEHCIPVSHRIHIPSKEDGDSFLCHNCYQETNSNNSFNMFLEEDVDFDEEEIETLYKLATQK